MIRVVTYDFWNTLLATREVLFERRASEWAAELAEAGHEVTTEHLRTAFAGSWKTFQADWRANRQHLTPAGVDAVLAHLDVEVSPLVRERLVDAYEDRARPEELILAPNLAEALATLTAAGVRVGIICDVAMTPGRTLRKELGQFGVLEHFHHFSFSDEVGTYKPDPAIFAHALEGLGGRPEEAAHVGDLRRTDVAGARGAGWTAVRYTGLHDDDGTVEGAPDVEAHHIIADHLDLPQVLGL